jgi:hypothetical protein
MADENYWIILLGGVVILICALPHICEFFLAKKSGPGRPSRGVVMATLTIVFGSITGFIYVMKFFYPRNTQQLSPELVIFIGVCLIIYAYFNGDKKKK